MGIIGKKNIYKYSQSFRNAYFYKKKIIVHESSGSIL